MSKLAYSLETLMDDLKVRTLASQYRSIKHAKIKFISNYIYIQVADCDISLLENLSPLNK